jgi:hypothetical protein
MKPSMSESHTIVANIRGLTFLHREDKINMMGQTLIAENAWCALN